MPGARITPGEAVRLDGYLVKAASNGLCSNDLAQWNVRFALADLTQSADFRGIYIGSRMMPTLLRRTKLRDMVSDQAVGEISSWLAQGFPHPSALGLQPELASLFPFVGLLGGEVSEGREDKPSKRARKAANGERKSLRSSDLSGLVGNAMHWAQAGTWLAYTLSTVAQVGP